MTLEQIIADALEAGASGQNYARSIAAALRSRLPEVIEALGGEQVAWRNPDPDYSHEMVPANRYYDDGAVRLGWQPLYALPQGGEAMSDRICVNCGHIRDVHGAHRTAAGGWRCNTITSTPVDSRRCRCIGFDRAPAATEESR